LAHEKRVGFYAFKSRGGAVYCLSVRGKRRHASYTSKLGSMATDPHDKTTKLTAATNSRNRKIMAGMQRCDQQITYCPHSPKNFSPRRNSKIMRKLFAAALIAGATFSAGLAQGTVSTSQSTQDVPNMGQAPKQMNGIGRLDLRVVDQSGNPVKGASAKLESRRSDGFLRIAQLHGRARRFRAAADSHGRPQIDCQSQRLRIANAERHQRFSREPLRVTLIAKSNGG
jgi:hypothetical protein